jgi:hypothetical protein
MGFTPSNLVTHNVEGAESDRTSYDPSVVPRILANVIFKLGKHPVSLARVTA